MMIYLKSFFVGMAAAFFASATYVLVVFVFPLLFPFLLSRITGAGGMAGASVSSGPVLVIAIVAFIAGFYWRLRRTR